MRDAREERFQDHLVRSDFARRDSSHGPLAQAPLAHDSRVQELEAQLEQLAFEEVKITSDTHTCLSPV